MTSRANSELTRLDAVFKGRVQGVGFRYTVVSIASSMDINGYVRNEWDGTVSLCAEGRREDLEGLLKAILCSSMAPYITGHNAYWGIPSGKYHAFLVA